MTDPAQREWFLREKERLEEQVKEEMQEAISNVQILTQNLEHLNDVGYELINISSVWVKFLQQVNGAAKMNTGR
ncbi:hypothetical protein Poli38472_006328 [Pythium oligandrum]|uniref:DASH complex subunit DAD1 n=2 Tax=Pythiaceae TaxID=4782 RepID=A0A8K1C4S3_PYTOL|nr:hypothetical protein Poli38472_006328 [Pythium oligandrum]DAZ94289.1 TPA: hypothetical protein N0F65_010886 [Lagenidium giganteum]|eukprot:TMW56318.1 hypothetical protein Poli38472_006328 [Pythium oligandrum]